MRLELCGISKVFGTHQALAALNLPETEFHSLAIIGPSGGGKTTLLRLLAGLERPDAGEIMINGQALQTTEQWLQLYRRTIGTVFQAYNLFPHLSALENIVLPMTRVHGVPADPARETAFSLLRRFNLSDHANRRPAELSGGQQQRVAIVRAIAVKPRFLLFDEPTSALDPEMTAEVLELIEELRAEGRNLIIVTHNMGFARKVADQCLFIAKGTLVEAGAVDDIFSAPRTPLLADFLQKVLKY